MWRTRGEGLELTAKGCNDLRRGNICYFVVGISFGAGAVLVEEYTKTNGQYFSEFIATTLHRALIIRAAETRKEKLLVLQNNYPSQNIAKATESLKAIGHRWKDPSKISGSKPHKEPFSKRKEET